jgi:hypothetical protein
VVLGVGQGVGVALDETAHALHAGRDERVTFTGAHGVGRHADRLQRRGAVAVDRGAGHVLDAGEDRHHAGHVEALLAAGQAAAEHQVLDLGDRELGHLFEGLADDLGGEVVGADVDEAALEGTPDGAAGGGDDDGFRHGSPPSHLGSLVEL